MPIFSSGFFRKGDGSAIIEFAIVTPVFFLIIFAMLEFGLFMYSKVIVENIAIEISRTASIGKSSDGSCSGFATREDYIRCVVKEKSSVLINGDQTEVQISTLTGGVTTVPDICFDADPPSSDPSTCKVYEEVNNKPGYQGSAASNAGAGGELIEARISYPLTVLLPLAGQFFERTDNQGNKRNTVMITAATVIRNEPFTPATSR